MPDETTPQAYAHIGGNQVIGFSNSKVTEGFGKEGMCLFIITLMCLMLLTFSESRNQNLNAWLFRHVFKNLAFRWYYMSSLLSFTYKLWRDRPSISAAAARLLFVISSAA